MQDEKIVRDEARQFSKSYLGERSMQSPESYHYPVKLFHEIKTRLLDFYTDEFKAIFLDELQIHITNQLVNHRNRAHQGQPKPDCPYETTSEKLLFYIRQELGILPIVAHQLHKTNPAQVRDRVFISYSHLDKEFLTDIQRHFKPFLSHINFWDDSKILPGQKWKEEIKKAINETKVAILLVSTDFLGSEFIASDELPPLLKAAEENGAVILIVILKPCLFEEFPELNQYQAINPPSKPLIKMDYTDKEDTLVNLVRQTKRILSDK